VRTSVFTGLGLFVVENALDEATMAAVLAEMQVAPAPLAQVMRNGIAGVDDSVRRCRDLEVSTDARDRVDAVLAEIRPRAARHFGRNVTVTERPHFLAYEVGDFFSSHVDDKPSAPYRKISIVIFVSDDQEGGELVLYGLFPDKDKDLGLPFRGAPGTLLAFPSDLPHEVKPVLAGRRLTIVSWFND
jgi:predicted 2-oxoglutarate/Fe(II)-dependent dioxygenase YbiX